MSVASAWASFVHGRQRTVVAVVAAIAALSLGLGLVLAATAGGGDGLRADSGSPRSVPAPPTGDLPAPPSPQDVVVATGAVGEVPVFDAVGATTATRSVTNPRPTGAPATFLVLQRREGWAEVLLPVRPNGGTGWVRETDVSLSQHGFRIVIELGLHRLTLFQGSVVARIETVGVGTAATPTPGGRYYTTELLQPADRTGPYGSFAYGLNGFTGEADGADTGAGGIGAEAVFGQLGLHGTNDPSTLGRDVSLGCIRMADEAIAALAGMLPLGVPVIVEP